MRFEDHCRRPMELAVDICQHGRNGEPQHDARRARSKSTMLPSVLLTDLYELTMLQAYFAERMNATAVFELFVRKLPPQRNFLLAAGLAQVVDYLANLRFTDDDLAWLEQTRRFRPEF